jgi:hypothetical protein
MLTPLVLGKVVSSEQNYLANTCEKRCRCDVWQRQDVEKRRSSVRRRPLLGPQQQRETLPGATQKRLSQHSWCTRRKCWGPNKRT